MRLLDADNGNAEVATTVTSGGGNYLFEDLTPGNYVVEFTAPSNYEFTLQDPLGSEATDSDADPVGGLTDSIAIDRGDELTNIDAGLISGKDDSWSDWQATFAADLGSQTGPGGNNDGDIYDNLLEYALCLHPGSGTYDTVPGGDGGFCAVLGGLDGNSGTVDAFFVRRLGSQSDLTYTLQTATALGSPPNWQPWAGPIPTVTDNGDGTETVVFTDLEQHVGTRGIVRLQVDLDDGTTTASSTTQTFGWHSQTNTGACETCSFPYAPKSIFSGTPGVGTSGTSLVVVGTPVLEAGKAYYIEVLSGTYEGHRFDVASVGTNNVTLDGASGRNTLNPLPDLAGAPFALRPHATIGSIAPPELFVATDDAESLTVDRILTFEGGVWTIYWVYDAGGTLPKQWTDVLDGGLGDAGGAAVDACQGFFLHPKSGDVDLTMVGVVREWAFACPLGAGYNLVGSGYPLDQSPDDRAMFRDDLADGDTVPGKNWFTASNDPLQADQLMFWLGDANAAAEGYETYFRLNLGVPSYDHWTYQGDSTLSVESAADLFKLGRGAFHDMMQGHDRSDPADVWLWPAPWNPDGA